MREKIRKKLKAKIEAKALIPELLEKSKKAYKKGDKGLSKTYSKKVRYLSMKYKIRLPKVIKRQLCKHCHSLLVPSSNCRVRTKEGKIIIYCLECKRFTRIPIK